MVIDMCLTPIRILNRSKWIAFDKAQQLYQYVNCGHCYECIRAKQNEWRLRLYFEALRCIKNGGFILFDTLTYNDEHLPKINDYVDIQVDSNFSCFRKLDVTLFLKRLRSYVPVKSVRYFIVSEYGSHNTLRPHYHCLFFVNGNINPLNFSGLISRAWSLSDGFSVKPIGRTDGIPYRSNQYVLKNVFDSVPQTFDLFKYLSKYVSKGFGYQKLITSRINRIVEFNFPLDDSNCDDVKIIYKRKSLEKELRKFVDSFHLQSSGFGDYLFEFYGMSNLINNPRFTLNLGSLPLSFALFPSFKRKLFYNRNKVDGVVSWFPNQNYINYSMYSLSSCISFLESRLKDFSIHSGFDVSGFNVTDFFVKLFRLCPSDSYFKNLVNSMSVDQFNGYRNYFSVDNGLLPYPCVTKNDYGRKCDGYSTLNRIDDSLPLSYLEAFCWYDDTLFGIYEKFLDYNKSKNSAFIEKLKKIENVKSKFKLNYENS